MNLPIDEDNLRFFCSMTILGWAHYYLVEIKDSRQAKESMRLKPFWISCLEFINENGEVEHFLGCILSDKLYIRHQKFAYNPCVQIGCKFLEKSGFKFELDSIGNEAVRRELAEIAENIGVTGLAMKASQGAPDRSARDDDRLVGQVLKGFDFEFDVKDFANPLGIEVTFEDLCFPSRFIT